MSKKLKIPRKKSDELLKGAFEDNFIDFLRFVYPDADSLFDFSKELMFMDKELNTIFPERERQKGAREADLLVKVSLLDGTEKWILVHTEIEAGSNTGFVFRLFQYYYRLIDRFQIPVETIVVYTGDSKQPRPSEYRYQGIGTSLVFRFRAIHIFDYKEKELLLMPNPFALIILACQKALLEGKIPEEVLSKDRLIIAKALIKSRYSQERVLALLVFLKNFIYISNQEINRIFDIEIQQISGGNITMGIIETVRRHQIEDAMLEGKLEGEHKKAVDIAREMKKEGMPVAQIMKFTKLSAKEIEKL